MDKEILQRTIRENGIIKQSVIAMEECSELTQAISKCLRCEYIVPMKNIEHLTEEMADVLIIIEQLKMMYEITDDELNHWIEAKVNRLEKRLSERK